MGLAPFLAAVVLAVSPVSFVQGHAAGGAYAEPGGSSDALLTSWAVLGLRAAGAVSPGSLAYLQSQEPSLHTSNDIAIVALAEQALGDRNEQLLSRLRVQASGQIGETLNSTYWGVLALGHSSRATTRFMLAQQTKAGGFAWFTHGQADSNDTAAALEALRVAGVHGRSRGRSGSCAPSSGPTEASSSLMAEAPTHSPRPGRSRASSPRVRRRHGARSPISRS